MRHAWKARISNTRTSDPITLAVIDHHNDVLEEFGLSLAESQELLAATQSALVRSRASVWITTQDYCHSCYRRYARKIAAPSCYVPYLAKLRVTSPRYWSCHCEETPYWQAHTISPLAQALPKRVTRELEYLQTKRDVHVPYAAATALLKEILPIQNCISASGTRHRGICRDKRLLLPFGVIEDRKPGR